MSKLPRKKFNVVLLIPRWLTEVKLKGGQKLFPRSQMSETFDVSSGCNGSSFLPLLLLLCKREKYVKLVWKLPQHLFVGTRMCISGERSTFKVKYKLHILQIKIHPIVQTHLTDAFTNPPGYFASVTFQMKSRRANRMKTARRPLVSKSVPVTFEDVIFSKHW